MTRSAKSNETQSQGRPKATHSSPSPIFVGTSGWAYPTWKPGFYPAGTSAKKFLEFYSSRLNSVEVNYTFRSLPSASMLAGWMAAVPQQFRFSFKAPQRITHFNRLANCAEALATFVGTLDPVRDAGKLGVLLFQLPPNFKAAPEKLEEFLSAPVLTGSDAPALAFEFRHESWFTQETYQVLRSHNAALCIAESEDLSTPEIHCADTHTCYRLRRPGGYSGEEIAILAEKYVRIAQNRAAYLYFKHEDEPTGALNAVSLLDEVAARAGKQ